MDTPALHATVMNDRCGDVIRRMDDVLACALKATKSDLAIESLNAIHQAYAAGVIDGFAQGVAAEAASNETTEATPA